VAFYPLPSGRLCAAFSCNAGDEHTGRGGKRIYTHNLVFETPDLARCAYNPFAVLRAMVEANDESPQLKPPPILPEVELSVTESALAVSRTMLDPILNAASRGHILHALLGEQSLIVEVAADWFETAEALLMGIPGPMREGISFGVGLKFSIARSHRLSLIHDDNGVTKNRIAGQQVEFIDPTDANGPSGCPDDGNEGVEAGSTWASFVERHWREGDTAGLAERTSRAFPDVSEAGRERIGAMYNNIDEISITDPREVLNNVASMIGRSHEGVEAEIAAEFTTKAQRSLVAKLSTLHWEDQDGLWRTLCALWSQSEQARQFARPLVERALNAASAKHPAIAAAAALELAVRGPNAAKGSPTSIDGTPSGDPTAVFDAILERLGRWAEGASEGELLELDRQGPDLTELVSRWRTLRPSCPIVERLVNRRAATSTQWN
jgi:hypothetical protein